MKGPRDEGLGYGLWGSGAVDMSVPETCGNVSVLRVLNNVRVLISSRIAYMLRTYSYLMIYVLDKPF